MWLWSFSLTLGGRGPAGGLAELRTSRGMHCPQAAHDIGKPEDGTSSHPNVMLVKVGTFCMQAYSERLLVDKVRHAWDTTVIGRESFTWSNYNGNIPRDTGVCGRVGRCTDACMSQFSIGHNHPAHWLDNRRPSCIVQERMSLNRAYTLHILPCRPVKHTPYPAVGTGEAHYIGSMQNCIACRCRFVWFLIFFLDWMRIIRCDALNCGDMCRGQW